MLKTLPRRATRNEKCASNLIEYPKYPKVSQTDNIQGTPVSDPYRGLENTTSEETQNWVNAQNRLTSNVLSSTIKTQKKIIEHFKSMYSKPQTTWLFPDEKGEPVKFGKYYYYKIVEAGLTPNWAIVRSTKKEIGAGEILLSTEKWGAPMRHLVTLRDVEIIQEGKYLVYEVNKFGSDWSEFFVIDLATGKHAPDDVKWVKGGISYSPDEKGCLYTQYEKPDQKYVDGNRREQVKYHVFGTPTSQDKLIYFDPKTQNRRSGWIF
ncbi:MAG: hypothetical protein KA715_04820 [Xanthomonadaceae bacterium]|nr:hypothetical protein [Xanthomonadaceae bacterium]